MLLTAGAAAAEPCTGVNRSMTAAQEAADGAAIGRQLGMGPVRLVGALRWQSWSIQYIEPAGAEPAFLFYNAPPSTTRYVTLWAGAASPSEERSIAAWAMQNAPGIPRQLADCFAWSAVHR